MTSRLAAYARRLIETGWLAAVIVVPLFFNVWSNRVFEPDKLTLLRSLTLMMAAAGVVIWVERGMPRPNADAIRQVFKLPLVMPFALLTASLGLATLFSHTRYVSLVGSHTRLQGFYTWLAYITVFVAILAVLRRREQVERLVTAIVLPSLPVALYAVVQKFGLDPMPWLGDVTRRVASTMGNSIFVSAYLIMVVPLTIARLVEALRGLDEDESQAAVFRVAGYLVLLFVQVLAIGLSQSRGPLLGLIVGAAFLMLLLAAARGRNWTLGLLTIGTAAAIFLGVLNIPNGPLEPLRDQPYTARLGKIFETSGGTGRVRVLIWGGALELYASDPLRAVIGHGPETMHVVYPPFYPPELGNLESRNASPDRSHNEALDVLVQAGLFGFLSYMFLYTSLFAYGLKWLGLIANRKELRAFLGLWLGGGALALLISIIVAEGDTLLQRATFFGVALPAGMIAGLLAWVVYRSLRGWTVPDRPGQLLIAALLAAIMAHFVEIHFGIAIAATRTLFFVLAGLLVTVGHFSESRPELVSGIDGGPNAAARSQVARKRKGKRRASASSGPAPSTTDWRSAAFTMLVLLATLTFDFIVRASFNLDPDAQTNDRADLFVLVWLLSLTWVLGSLILGSEVLASRRIKRGAPWGYIGLSLVGFFTHGAIHWGILRAGSQSSAGAVSSTLLYLFYIYLFILVAAWALALAFGDVPEAAVTSGRALWLYPIVALAALVMILMTNVNKVRADIIYKEGFAGHHANATNAGNAGRVEQADLSYAAAIRNYEKALELDPRQDYYMLFRGKAMLERAENNAIAIEPSIREAGVRLGASEYEDQEEIAPLVNNRDERFLEAITALEKAYETAPLNHDHSANLARAYQIWGDRTYDPDRRAERLELSRVWFAGSEELGIPGAITLSPKNAELREQLATTEYVAGDYDAALLHVQDALEIDSNYARPLRLRASIRIDQAETATADGNTEAADEFWALAEEDYEAFVLTRTGQRNATGWSGLALVRARQGDLDGAREANEKVLEFAPRDLDTLRNLAILERDAGDAGAACSRVITGLSIDPGDGGMLQLDATLGCGAAAALESEASEDDTDG